MGFLSSLKVAESVQPQPGVSPQENLRNIQASGGLLGKLFARMVESGQLQATPATNVINAVVQPSGAASPATPSTPAVAQGYSVTPQALSIGQTNFRTLPVNMLSRLSLASLKDILSMYDKEGENVPKMAEGGEVERPELIADLRQIPASAQATVQPVDMPGVARQVLSESIPKTADGYKVPAYDPSKDPMVERGYTRLTGDPTELGFKLRECGPMGCVAPQVMGYVYNPSTGQYIQTAAGNPYEEMPEGWQYSMALPKAVYGERGPIEQMPIAPNPVAPTAPESPYIVNPYSINLGQTQSTPVQPSQPTAQAPQVSRPVYQMPQYQAPPMPAYLQEYVDRTSGNNAPLQSTLMDFLRRQGQPNRFADGGEVQGYADGGFMSVFGQASQDGPLKTALGALAAQNPEVAERLGIKPTPTPAPTPAVNPALGLFSQSPVLGNVLQQVAAQSPEAAKALGITPPAPTPTMNPALGLFSQSPTLGRVLQQLGAQNPEVAKALGMNTAGTAGMSATPVAAPTTPTEVSPAQVSEPAPTPEPVPVSNAYTVTPQQIRIGQTTLMPSADLMTFLRNQRMV